MLTITEAPRGSRRGTGRHPSGRSLPASLKSVLSQDSLSLSRTRRLGLTAGASERGGGRPPGLFPRFHPLLTQEAGRPACSFPRRPWLLWTLAFLLSRSSCPSWRGFSRCCEAATSDSVSGNQGPGLARVGAAAKPLQGGSLLRTRRGRAAKAAVRDAGDSWPPRGSFRPCPASLSLQGRAGSFCPAHTVGPSGVLPAFLPPALSPRGVSLMTPLPRGPRLVVSFWGPRGSTAPGVPCSLSAPHSRRLSPGPHRSL